jgi:voltage-gated potassium channel
MVSGPTTMNSTGDGSLRSRQFQLAVALLGVVFVAGTGGYMAIEGWSAWDAFYMTVISVSTAGYREVHTLSRAGEVFTSLLLIFGVGTAFYAFTLVAASIIESRLHPRIQEKRRARMIDQLTDHFILCGAGRIGLIIAEEFRRQRVPFVVIDHDPAAVQEVLRRGDLGPDRRVRRALRVYLLGFFGAPGALAQPLYTVRPGAIRTDPR